MIRLKKLRALAPFFFLQKIFRCNMEPHAIEEIFAKLKLLKVFSFCLSTAVLQGY